MNTYLKLFDELDRFGASSYQKLLELLASEDQRYKLTDIVTEFFIDNGPKIVDNFLQTPGNRLVFYDADGIMQDVSKKALLYSEISLFISSNSVEREISYSIADSDGAPLSEYSYTPIKSTMVQDLFALKPLLVNGTSIFLPEQIMQTVHTSVGSYNRWSRQMKGALDNPPDKESHLFPAMDFSVPRDGLNAVRLETSPKGVMEVLSGRENVHPQLTDSQTEASGLAVRLFLPNLADMPLATMLKLREDENDAFVRFQHVLSKFFKADPQQDCSASFLEMLDEVDHEIRTLNQRFEEIKRKAIWETTGLSIMTMGLTSLYFLPDATSKLISQIGGVTTLPAILSYIAGGEWSSRKLRDSDFYYAWKVARQKRKK